MKRWSRGYLELGWTREPRETGVLRAPSGGKGPPEGGEWISFLTRRECVCAVASLGRSCYRDGDVEAEGPSVWPANGARRLALTLQGKAGGVAGGEGRGHVWRSVAAAAHAARLQSSQRLLAHAAQE